MNVLLVSQKDMFVFSVAVILHGALISVICAFRDVMMNLRAILKGSSRADILPELVSTCQGFKYSVIRGIWDFLICVVSAVLLLVVCFVFNDGKTRVFSIFLSGLSFWAFSKVIGKPLRYAFAFAVKIINRIFNAILAPIRYVVREITGLISKIKSRIKASAEKRRIEKYTEKILFGQSDRKENGMLTETIKE